MYRQSSRDICGTTCLVLLSALPGCGGDDSTELEEPAFPDVGGIYDVVQVSEVPSCDPATALDVLGDALSSGTIHLKIRVDQQDAEAAFTLLEVEGEGVAGSPPSVTTIDEDGGAHLDLQASSQLSLPGAETLFEQISSSAAVQFDAAADPATFTVAGTATHVYRTGSSTGPVFATCTQSDTETGTRTTG